MTTCNNNQYSLFQGQQTCDLTSCGQFSKCLSLYKNDIPTGKIGCCREGYLYPNVITIIVYILIIPIIGIGAMGALGGQLVNKYLGGVVKRPFLEAILNYDSTISGNITACIMFAAQLVNQIIITFQKHPNNPERPIVNYDIGLIYALAIPLSMQVGDELAAYLPLIPLLTLQMMFFVVICPILILYAKRAQAQELYDSSATMLTEIKGNIQDEAKRAALFQVYLEESNQTFPLVPILLALLNFAINESISLTRTTNYQTSPYFHDEIGENGETNQNPKLNQCDIWQLYMMILLFVVNGIFTLGVLFYMRKKEQIKDYLQFNTKERYYTPLTRFFTIYAAGWATGFIAGFLGMAAGLTMFVTMVEFGLVAGSAGATANYGYFIVCLEVFASFLVAEPSDQDLSIGYQFFFYGLAIVGVLVFTNLGYYLIGKYNIGHILFYIDLGIIILNMAGNIAYGIEQSDRLTYENVVVNSIQQCQ